MLLYILRSQFTLNPGAGDLAGKQRPGSPITCAVPGDAKEPDRQGRDYGGGGRPRARTGAKERFPPGPDAASSKAFCGHV